MVDTASKGLIRTNFSLRGFAKIVSPSTLSSTTPNPVALSVFGRFLATLNLQPSDPLSFASVPEFRGVDYVGYIIEKERLDPTDGTWIRLEEYRIMGQQACSYQDTRVAYGSTYRYRVRSVVKFTYPSAPVPNSTGTAQAQLGNILSQALQASAQTNASLLQRLGLQGLQPKSSTNAATILSFTDKINVSINPQGVPQFNFNLTTANTQATAQTLDAIQLALASSTPIANSTIASYINTLQSYQPPSNSGKTYSSQYLVSPPNRNWQYVVVKNNTLPPWPQNFKVVPSTPNSSIGIYWLPPPDDKRDLASMTLYRRNKMGDPWAILAKDMPVRGTGSFQDTACTLGKSYIYALSAKNIHGYESFLSSQIEARLNESFTFEQREKPLKWISGPGVRPNEPDTIMAAFYDESEQLVALKNVVISPAKAYGELSTDLLLRFRSLDTQEKQEVVLNLRNLTT